MTGLSQYLERSSNPILNLQRAAIRVEPSGVTGDLGQGLNDETFGGAALQPQSAECMEVGNRDTVEQHMHNVCVVPNTFCRQGATSHHHAIDGIVLHSI